MPPIFWLRDPDGNSLMIVEPTSQQKHDKPDEEVSMSPTKNAPKAHKRTAAGKRTSAGSALPKADREMAERLRALITTTAPELSPRTWYGMPASRYATLGFSDKARLDDGHMWPTDFAPTKLTAAEEKQIAALVKKAVS